MRNERSDFLAWLPGEPCFQIYGKAEPEAHWRVIDVYARTQRDRTSRVPLCAGACTTWSSQVIVVGRDFAQQTLKDQFRAPTTRLNPATMHGTSCNRQPAGPHANWGWTARILAHECGHTYQALRLGPVYLPFVGLVTLCGEGPRPWNHFENEASRLGQFGGIVPGSVSSRLWNELALGTETIASPDRLVH